MNQTKPASKRLFVGSLPYRFTEGELLNLFISEGKIVSIRIMHNRWGKSRGLGYVEYENLDDAISAKQKYHNYKIADRTIIVDYAQPDPFLTPEGQARHQEALKKHPHRHQAPAYFDSPKSSNYSKKDSKDQSKRKSKGGKPIFNSLGKSLNHNTTGEYVPKFFPKVTSKKTKKYRPKPGQKPEYKSSHPLHVRSSVFKQRNFGARSGAKFAAKSRKKSS